MPNNRRCDGIHTKHGAEKREGEGNESHEGEIFDDFILASVEHRSICLAECGECVKKSIGPAKQREIVNLNSL